MCKRQFTPDPVIPYCLPVSQLHWLVLSVSSRGPVSVGSCLKSTFHYFRVTQRKEVGLETLLIPQKMGSKGGLQAPVHHIKSGETLEA